VNSLPKIKIIRGVKIVTYPFTDYFKGFEQVKAVKCLFGEQAENILKDLRVEFTSGGRYMGVSSEDGHLRINAQYLNTGKLMDIYLDIIHELVHVKQFMEGKELRDRNFQYIDRPTEIEAFQHAVNEARNLGMNDKQILEYLKTETMSKDTLYRLAKAVNVYIN
jgi:predicted SprT family Zn-dependent metalloprotease